MTAARKQSRFSEQDWLNLGLKVLGKFGPQALTIDRLCTRAKRTKGSFYHHFKDHDAFITALMAHWRASHTDDLIQATEPRRGKAGDKLIVLNDLAAALSPGIEIGIRRLAANSPIAAEFVKKADEARIAHLSELHVTRGTQTRGTAREIAEIEYAVFIGAMTIWPQRTEKDFAKLGRKLAELIG